ncbi:MAG TPA: hypothetical protein VMU76_13700 [Acidimicrobiales bacterium]|nr:hypothetical protein [Acidimicrobiales bacterium]
MAMLTIDWTEVGAIATAAAVLVGLVAVVLLVLLARASQATAAATGRLADAGHRLSDLRNGLDELSRGLAERSDELVGLVSRQVQLGEIGADVAQEHLHVLQDQVEIGGQALLATHAPLLVPTKLSPGAQGEGPLQVVLPDGVYYAPAEQSVGAWTIEPGDRKLVVSCAFLNVGIGPAVLHPYHRIDIVRRGSVQPLVSFGGYANGVVAVNAKAVIGFPLSAAEPSFGATLTLLDRPDDEMQLMVTIYYRSASSSRPLWSRVRYQRHLRTSPAGLLSEVSLELSSPDASPS